MTPGNGIMIPDTTYYTNDSNKLSDDEIKKLFFNTVSETKYEINEIIDVKAEEQDFQYEI